MDAASGITKEKKLKIVLSAVAILLLVVTAYLLVMKPGGAWLVDRGVWSNANYTLGRIDYTYELNGSDIPFPLNGEELMATVPIIGGVKLNDQSDTTGVANYEKNAEQNFNDGVTLAHIRVENNGDFDINIGYSFELTGMADGEDPKDVFCLILPQGATVDTQNKTVTVKDGTAVSYKSYVKAALGAPSDYTQMTAALKNYYATNKELKNPSPVQIKKGKVIEADILFWCEYNINLPFVTTSGEKDDVLRPSSESVKPLTAVFTMKFANAEQVVPTLS